MKKITTILTMLVMIILLTSCINNNSNRVGEKVEIEQEVTITKKASFFNKLFNNAEDTTEVVTIKKEIFINPKRVATFSYSAADILNFAGLEDAGIELFGIAKGANLPSMLEMFNDNTKYPNVGTLFEENLDTLDIFDPELIILDGRSAALYTKLSKEYPNSDILDVSNTTFSLATQIKVVNNLSKIFPNISSKLLDEMELIKNDFNNIKELTNNKEALFILSNGGTKISTFGKGSRYNSLFDEFGFSDANKNQSIGDSHGLTSSLELINDINPEIIFILDRASATNAESGVAELLNQALFKSTKASINNDVYILNAEAWYLVTGGFTSSKEMIKDIYKYINKI